MVIGWVWGIIWLSLKVNVPGSLNLHQHPSDNLRLRTDITCLKFEPRIFELIFCVVQLSCDHPVPVCNVPFLRKLCQRARLEYVWGSGSVAPLTLILSIGSRWVISFTPRPLPPPFLEKYLVVHTEQVTGWARRSGTFGEEKHISCPCRESNHNTSVVQPVPSLVHWVHCN